MDLQSSFPSVQTIDITALQDHADDQKSCVKMDPPKRPTLRKRKASKKAMSVKALDHVSDVELLLTALPAHSCRIINCKLRQTDAWLESDDKERVPCITTSDGFYVKTANIDLYSGELSFRELEMWPSNMCPLPDVHMERMANGKDLPLACPTCWSLQRNG